MKNMQTKVLEVIEDFIRKLPQANSGEKDFIVNEMTEKCGTAFIMDSYSIEISMYYEFFSDYFLFVVFPKDIKPSIQSMNEKLHLEKFIIEYHKGNEIKYLLEYLNKLLATIYQLKDDEKTISQNNNSKIDNE